MSYDFKFSVLMPIYNVEEYLNDAIDSLINQTIGFEDSIELVIVDDGSPDNSKDIALKYQEKYPNNIKIFSKSNGGQASAFNFGLNHLHGKYISFMDSDDYVSLNTFQEVYEFFEEHNEEIDLVSIPIMFFERRTGPHILNYKFKSTRVIDLVDEPENSHLSLASSFIRKEALEGIEFDTTLPLGYDALVVNKILLNKKKIGVIESSSYFYRKRYNMSSMVDNSRKTEKFYNHFLKNFYINLIDYSKEKEGNVPEFIQYVIAYNLQWLHSTADFPDYFTKDKIDDFWDTFYEILSYVDEGIIKDSVNIRKKIVRFFLLYVKNHRDFHIDTVDDQSKIYLRTGDFTINNLHNHRFYIDDIDFDNGVLKFLGTFTSLCDYDTLNIEAVKTLPDGTKQVYNEELSDYSKDNSRVKRILGIDWQFKHCFDLKIPIEKEEESKIEFNMVYNENNKRIVLNNKIIFRNSTLLTDKINYFVKDSQIVFFKDNVFNVYPFSDKKFNELKDELSDKGDKKSNIAPKKGKKALKNRCSVLNKIKQLIKKS